MFYHSLTEDDVFQVRAMQITGKCRQKKIQVRHAMESGGHEDARKDEGKIEVNEWRSMFVC